VLPASSLSFTSPGRTASGAAELGSLVADDRTANGTVRLRTLLRTMNGTIMYT
jgi:hypothetical protein